jgi:KDO2-lipid IV(A) lauroyltransferase
VRLLSRGYRRRVLDDVHIVGADRLVAASPEGTGFLLVTVHLGDFELAAAWLTEVAGREVVAVVDRVSPRLRQLFFDRVRRACGVALRRQDDVSVEDLQEDLAAGRIVVLMLDRTCRSGRVGGTFLGQAAALPTAAWHLSIASAAPVLPGAMVRLSDGSWRINFGAATDHREVTRLGAEEFMQRVADELGGEIRRHLDQWHVPADASRLPFTVETSSVSRPEDCRGAPRLRSSDA